MRVLMIPSFFKNVDNKMSGEFFIDQAVAMVKKGYSVSIVFTDTYSIKYVKRYLFYKEKNEIIEGVRIYRKRKLALLKHDGIKGCEKEFVRGCLEIVASQWNGEFPFDIIHAQNCVWAGSVAKTLSEKYGIPFVVTEHSSMFELRGKGKMKSVENNVRDILNAASKIACVSEQLRRTVSNYTEKPIGIIGNIVDIGAYQLGDKHTASEEGFTYITVAFLNTEERIKLKGIDLLLNGFKAVLQTIPDARLKIVGVPSDFLPMTRRVERLGLENNVYLIPPISRTKIVEAFSKSNCFVLLSNYETFGLVCAEAMAAGLPVIASDVGIASEIINEKTGYICSERSIENVSKGMLQVYKNYSHFSFDFIRQQIIDKYSEEIISEAMEEMYISACE